MKMSIFLVFEELALIVTIENLTLTAKKFTFGKFRENF